MSVIMRDGVPYAGVGATDDKNVKQNILPELTIRPLLLANSQTNSAEIAECYKDRRLKYGTGTLQVVGDTTGSYTGAKIETIAYNAGYSNVNVRSFNGNDVRTEVQMYADSTKAALRSVTKNNAAEVSKDLISVDVNGNIKTDCVLATLLGEKANLVSTTSGNFNGLVLANQTWLIIVQRLSTASACILVCQNYNNTVYVAEIVKSSAWTYTTNSQGTVSVKYSNSDMGVYGGAIRLN